MMETARLGCRERVRGIFFIVALDGLDDAGVDTEFDEFARNAQGIFDGERAACPMGNDGYPVDTDQRTPAIRLVICPIADGEKSVLGKQCAELSNRACEQLVLQPV